MCKYLHRELSINYTKMLYQMTIPNWELKQVWNEHFTWWNPSTWWFDVVTFCLRFWLYNIFPEAFFSMNYRVLVIWKSIFKWICLYTSHSFHAVLLKDMVDQVWSLSLKQICYSTVCFLFIFFHDGANFRISIKCQ